MSKRKGEQTQRTRKGYEIPLPKKSDVVSDLKKIVRGRPGKSPK